MTTPKYTEFLAGKTRAVPSSGIDCTPDDVNETLFDFQRHITAWAVRRGRAAIWADTGLGKSRMQVEWARLVTEHGGRALIFAPLAVAQQTIREAAAIGVELTYAHSQAEVSGRFTISNYDRLHLFDPSAFAAVVLDESSILKALDGKTRTALIAAFQHTPYRLACTATPAPNDVAELGNHAEFLSVSSRVEMLAAYFVHDDDGWRLKGHASEAMWRWVSNVGARVPQTVRPRIRRHRIRPPRAADHPEPARRRRSPRRATVRDRPRRRRRSRRGAQAHVGRPRRACRGSRRGRTRRAVAAVVRPQR